MMTPAEKRQVLDNPALLQKIVNKANAQRVKHNLPVISLDVVKMEYELAIKADELQDEVVKLGNSQSFDQEKFNEKKREAQLARQDLITWQVQYNL